MIEPLESRIAPATLSSVFRFSTGQDGQGASAPSVIAVDSAGNTLVAGTFYGLFDGNPANSPIAQPTQGSLYVAKIAPDNTLLWASKWTGNGGGVGSQKVKAIAVDASDNVFVTGEFSTTSFNFDGPGGGVIAVGQDVFLFKLKGTDGLVDIGFSTDGVLKWGGDDTALTGGESPSSIAIDSTGAVIVAGSFVSANAGFGGGATIAANGIDGFVFKVSGTTGAPVAAFGNGGMVATGIAGEDHFLRVALDSNNDLFLTATEPNAPNITDEVVKLSGANGTPVGTFGTNPLLNGRIPLGSHLPSQASPLDVAIDHGDGVVVLNGSVTGGSTVVSRLDHLDGSYDISFNASSGFPGIVSIPFFPAAPAKLNIDNLNQIYFSGNDANTGNSYVARVSFQGVSEGLILSTKTNLLDATIDTQDRLTLRGTYAGSLDLDPTQGTLSLPARAGLPKPMSEGYVALVDPYGIDAKNPLNLTDADGDLVTVKFSGAGRAHYRLGGNLSTGSDIDTLTLIGTNLTSQLTVQVATQDTSVLHILTRDNQQHMGGITLGTKVAFGDEALDFIPDLHITGKLNKLVLDEVVQNTVIQLGDGLPYNVTLPNGAPENITPDTYNNHPDVTIGRVRGPGVQIDVIGALAPLSGPNAGQGPSQGVGGGGLGKVVIGSWDFPGFIRTTQSIGDFTVLNGDPGNHSFQAVLEVDKFGVGAFTTANCGNMTIQNGSWGSAGSEIEGNVNSFDADAFLLGATLTVASIGPVTVNGKFDGLITTTDPDSPAIPTFTVNSDYTGNVVSASPLKKLKVKGAFNGSLTAPLIGSITAYSFVGKVDGLGVPTTHITATTGGLGTFTATAGAVTDYTVSTPLVFKGFNVKLSKLEEPGTVVGIDNVHIEALAIGNISVSLAALATGAGGVNLIGIRDSDFVTTGLGATKATLGSIGNVTVTLTGGSGGGAATGIQDSTFDALVVSNEFGNPNASTVNPLGRISVKISGQDGVSLGLDGVDFSGNSIGATTISVTPGKGSGATATAIDAADFTATGAIGALSIGGNATSSMVKNLKVSAGTTVGAVTVKSTTLANGTLQDSAILAGQALSLIDSDPAKLRAALVKATLGAVNISGSLTNTDLVAGSSIGAVTVGGSATDSLILAGGLLGPDGALGGTGDSFQRAASIAAVAVRGSFARTSIVAGINPGDGVFGNAGDALAAGAGTLTNSSFIGPITLSAGTLAVSTGTQHFAIEAAKITGLKLGTAPAIAITIIPQLLDVGPVGVDGDDVRVQVLA